MDTMESLFANTEARIITAYKVFANLLLRVNGEHPHGREIRIM